MECPESGTHIAILKKSEVQKVNTPVIAVNVCVFSFFDFSKWRIRLIASDLGMINQRDGYVLFVVTAVDRDFSPDFAVCGISRVTSREVVL